MLKVFAPIYLSLVLLVASVFQGFQDIKIQNKIIKAIQEMNAIFAHANEDFEIGPLYSVKEYGVKAPVLNGLKNSLHASVREKIKLVNLLNALNLDTIFTDEVMLKHGKIIEKKKELEQFSMKLKERIRTVFNEIKRKN